MAKSLFGFEQEKKNRKLFEIEDVVKTVIIKAVIVEVISNYRQLEDLSPEIYDAIVNKLNFDYEIMSGLHFVILTENDEYAIVESPYCEDEVRAIYGSDAMLRGRLLHIESEEQRLDIKDKVRRVSIANSSKEYLQDNDMYMPITIAGVFGSSINGNNKIKAFQANKRSGRGGTW